MSEVQVQIETLVYLTEEEERVIECLENLFTLNTAVVEKIKDERGTRLIVKGSRDLLEKTKKSIQERNIETRIVELLKQNKRVNHSKILFDKQAAYAGVLATINAPDESSLGPVSLTIRWETQEEFKELLGWFESP